MFKLLLKFFFPFKCKHKYIDNSSNFKVNYSRSNHKFIQLSQILNLNINDYYIHIHITNSIKFLSNFTFSFAIIYKINNKNHIVMYNAEH